jgi:hypothetical protein
LPSFHIRSAQPSDDWPTDIGNKDGVSSSAESGGVEISGRRTTFGRW